MGQIVPPITPDTLAEMFDPWTKHLYIGADIEKRRDGRSLVASPGEPNGQHWQEETL